MNKIEIEKYILGKNNLIFEFKSDVDTGELIPKLLLTKYRNEPDFTLGESVSYVHMNSVTIFDTVDIEKAPSISITTMRNNADAIEAEICGDVQMVDKFKMMFKSRLPYSLAKVWIEKTFKFTEHNNGDLDIISLKPEGAPSNVDFLTIEPDVLERLNYVNSIDIIDNNVEAIITDINKNIDSFNSLKLFAKLNSLSIEELINIYVSDFKLSDFKYIDSTLCMDTPGLVMVVNTKEPKPYVENTESLSLPDVVKLGNILNSISKIHEIVKNDFKNRKYL